MIFAFFASCAFNQRLGAIWRLDIIEHPHRFFVRAAMEWTLQRSAGRSDGRIHVRQGRSRHARRKGGRIEFMVRVKNVNRVEHSDLPMLRDTVPVSL